MSTRTVTRGNEWMQPSTFSARILHRFCRLVNHTSDINLSCRGGYAIKSEFLPFDRPVVMEDGRFLVVAHQRFKKVSGYSSDTGRPDLEVPDGYSKWYEVALVRSCQGQAVEVPHADIAKTVVESKELSKKQIGRACEKSMYTVAAYAWLVLRRGEIARSHMKPANKSHISRPEGMRSQGPRISRRPRRHLILNLKAEEDED